MKRSFFSYWSIPVVFVVVFTMAIGLFLLNAYLFGERDYIVHYRSQCLENLKHIGLAMAMYSQDYGQRLPPVIFPGKTVGWANRLQPYLKSQQIFQCPSEINPRQDNPYLPGFTDYWMNRNAAGVESTQFDNPFYIILMGDGDGGSPQSNASYAINQLPASWQQIDKSPANRHLGGANYAFVDGHVKWLKPDDVSQLASFQNANAYTFSIR